MKKSVASVLLLGVALIAILNSVTQYMARGFADFEQELTLTQD